jgi:osmotically-inducible protein OsmY
VTTTDGKVSLEGDVASAEEKAKAADIARNTNGVTEVQNKLHVAAQPGEGARDQGKENQG